MIGMRAVVKDETSRVRRAVKASAIRTFPKAGAYLRGITQRSIKISKAPSLPRRPPHSRKGRLKKAIFFAAEKARQDVVVGPTVSVVARVGQTHEFGGKERPKGPKVGKGRTYPPRPFMGPALKVGKARLPKFWANSVRGG